MTQDIYFISGTRRQAGATDTPENFQEEITATSSREAYLTILKKPGFTHVHVIAIKMICIQCGQAHMTVPTSLYLGV